MTSTADLYDEHGERLQVADPVFRDFGGEHAFSGPVRTVKAYEDNTFVREALSEPGQGHVLVVDAGASMRCAMLGDLMAKLAVDNGWRGIVIWGCVRDSAVLATMPLGVKALATNPRKSVKRGEGQRGIRLDFAGLSVEEGDWLYADEDGIVVLDKERMAQE